MTEKTKSGMARRPYEPPRLEQVELVVEEILLGNCKTTQAAGMGLDMCIPGGTGPCQGGGS